MAGRSQLVNKYLWDGWMNKLMTIQMGKQTSDKAGFQQYRVNRTARNQLAREAYFHQTWNLMIMNHQLHQEKN